MTLQEIKTIRDCIYILEQDACEYNSVYSKIHDAVNNLEVKLNKQAEMMRVAKGEGCRI